MKKQSKSGILNRLLLSVEMRNHIGISTSESDMRTFAGIVSDALQERDVATLAAMLPTGSLCETYQKAMFGACPGSDGAAPVVSFGDGRGKVISLFSGRLANAAELREMLEKSGHHPRNSRPEELLIHLYEKYGSDAFSRMKGAFSAAVYDASKHRLLLGRDIIGSEPLYYFIHRDVLVFANSLAVLEKHPLMPRDPDVNAVGTFLSLQYIPEPDTVFRNVRKLPSGHLLEMRLETANASIRSFGKLDFSAKRTDLSFADAKVELRRMLEHLVAVEIERRNGDIGVFLSGGVDSTILAALAARHAGGRQIDVFTVGFSDAAYDERNLARESVSFINAGTGGALNHHVRELEPCPLELAEKLAAYHDEPYADVSVLPTHLLCGFAAEKVGAAFGGDGGDEFFAGYERYSAMRIAGFFDLLPEQLRKGVFSILCNLVPDAGERTLCGRARRLLKLMADSSSDAYFNLLDRCPEELRRLLFGPKLKNALWHRSAEAFTRLEWELTALNPTEGYSELDIRTYLPGDGCTKLNIAAGAAGLDVTTPYLDWRIMDFSTSLPFEYKMLGRCRKRILKEAFSDILPPELFKRRKRGFGTPMARWFRSCWKTGTGEALFESTLCRNGYIERGALQSIWDAHMSGNADYSYLLWSLVNLAWFLRRHQL